ncbi:MAG: phage terminase large subunit [Bacteroidales bacterium]|nr:phage terminase large subunit [Bacteroidales bacterium]
MKLLLPKQENAIYYLNDNTTTEIVYGGAAGGGKTALLCLRAIEQSQKYKGSRWLLGRSKLKTLKETTLNTFFELSARLDIGNQFVYRDQRGVIDFKNGSQIILKDLFLYPSDPDYDSLGSLEISGGFIDECSQIAYKAWQITKSRIRYKLKEFDIAPKLIGTCNPSKGWTYQQFYKAEKENTIRKYRKFIQALPTDNHHLPESYLQSLLELDEISRQRLYYGNWEYDDDPATLMDYEKIVDLFSNSYVRSGQRVITADIARLGKDSTVIMIWEGLKVIRIIKVDKSLTTDTVGLIRKLQLENSIPRSNVICDEDGVGGGVVDMLKCVGFVNNSRPLKENYEIKNYQNLRSQCYFKLADYVNTGKIYISTTDGQTNDDIAEELEQIKQANIDKDGKLTIIPKETIKNNIGRSPDYSDTLMMRMYFELQPRPKGAKFKVPSYN